MSNDIQVKSSNSSIFNVDSMSQVTHFAELMSQGISMLPEHLQGKPADCMAVALQAASWGMNPFVVAQKTHIVNGTLGYEAQLVNAVVSSSRAIVGRFHYRTIGDWSKWKYTTKKITKKGKGGSTYQVDVHSGLNEQGLGVQVGAILYGETEITWDDVLYIEHIENRNSPLWQTRPLQQMKYLGVKYWARIYCPEVILGVYTPDELAEPQPAEREINPVSKKTTNENVSIEDVFSGDVVDQESQSAPEKDNTSIEDVFTNEAPVDEVGLSKFEELKSDITKANTLNDLLEVGGYVNEAYEAKEITDKQQYSLKCEYQKKKNSF